ncbi:MAG: lamin tail domain-containing protein, partial [Gammaproteobacteria bacterium]|nr:lamin tail domain-containing protein [Gammaproteobacteria bacterium]
MGVLKQRTCVAQGHGGGTRLRAVAVLLGTLALSLVGEVRGAAPTLASATVEHAGSTGTFTSVTMVDDGTSGDTTAADGVFSAQVPVYANDLPRYRFTYTFSAATSTPVVDVGTTPTTLFINELMASNSTTVLDPQGEADDWIELKNTGTAAIDLGGMYLSDKAANPLKWQFPAGTSIDAGGYLLIWADDDDGDSPGVHTNFKLSTGGESVVLSDVDARSNALIDSVTFPAQTTDVSYGRSPEATGAFQALAVASPGRATPTLPEIGITAGGPVTEGGTATFSVTAAPAPTAALAVAVSVTQATGDDYLPTTLPTSVTIASAATAATLSVAIPNDTVDEPNGVLTVTIAAGTGYTVSTTNPSASLTIRDDDANPAASAVVINELMASNSTTAQDPQGDADDWIELMNTSDATVDLSGMYLSDDRANAKKWQFPAGTTIAAGGYLVVWADDDTADSPGLHANFKLSSGGESVVLSDNDANGNTVTDAVDFPALGSDLSYGRVPEGSGPFQVIGTASPGAALPAVPTVTVASNGPATEGSTASFTVVGSYAPTSAVTVNVSVTQGSGQSYLPASPPTSVTIAANAKTATLEVSLPDDTVDEPNGVITATVGPGAGYLLGNPAAASTTARDNDGGPAMSVVAINELMAANTNTILDPQGDDDDWIELKNTTSATVDLSGMYLSDDASDPKKWPFPAGTSLAGEAYLLVWADDDDGDTPGLHANFKLSAKGETVVLSDSDANGNTLIDVVQFGALDEDEGFGRMPNGSGAFRTLPATPGAANPIVPTLRIVAGPTATEGGTANFTIRADPAPAADLAVDVSVTQEAGADYLPAAPPTSVTIAANATRATLAVALPDDAVDEPNGDITARIVPSADSRYDVATESATLTVRDNDLPPPLTAAFHGMPASHDATSLIRFELRFSEDFPGAAGLRDVLLGGALRVTNGSVSQADRATPGQNRVWSIAVRPDSYADVTVALPATTDCAAAAAVCAEDGRPLSNSLSATVEGPPPLTAAFHGMPASHDATSLIRFELRF